MPEAAPVTIATLPDKENFEDASVVCDILYERRE